LSQRLFHLPLLYHLPCNYLQMADYYPSESGHLLVQSVGPEMCSNATLGCCTTYTWRSYVILCESQSHPWVYIAAVQSLFLKCCHLLYDKQ
jgi:hypothetical protein